MTKTKREYNKKKTLNYYHPYYQICCGNCHRCKDHKGIRKRRKENRRKSREILLTKYGYD